MVGYMLWYLYKTRDLIMKSLINIFAMISSFIVGILPLIVFDIRNDFINFKSFLGIFSEDQLVSSSRGIMEIFHTFAAFNEHALHISAPTIIHALFFIIMILATPRLIKGKKNYIHILVFFWITLFFTSYFTNNKHQHYFGFLYPLYLSLIHILVTDNIGRKLSDVTVSIAGYSISSDKDGQYNAVFVTSDKPLIFSKLGYGSKRLESKDVQEGATNVTLYPKKPSLLEYIVNLFFSFLRK